MSELKALLFDVDGTLADTERDGHRVAFNLAFRDAGLDWYWDEALYGRLLEVTGGKERIHHYIDTQRPLLPDVEDLPAFIAGLHRSKTQHYTRMLREGAIPLRPGVLRLLDEARAAGMVLGIATTTTPANVSALLEFSIGPHALEWFDVIAAGDVVPDKKPAPDIYLHAMQELGLTPGEVMAFEDSFNGVRAVLDAGIQTLVVTVNDYTADHDFTGATLVVDSLGEPGSPCRPLNGSPAVPEYLDLAYIKRLHAGSADA